MKKFNLQILITYLSLKFEIKLSTFFMNIDKINFEWNWFWLKLILMWFNLYLDVLIIELS